MNAPHVLVVDDNAMNVELVRFVLLDRGFQVRAAYSALEAVDCIAAARPDLILMDVQLPGMDGLELTRRLKAAPDTRDIIVIAFTAYAMLGDEAKMRAAGCDGYLSKPIQVATFAQEVGKYVGWPAA